MYLGNILLALVDTAPHTILFGDKATQHLNQYYELDTEVLSYFSLTHSC
jgi:hypothetical protein